MIYTIEVIEPLKNKIYQDNKLRSFISTGVGTCDGYFKVGETYLIYANSKDIFLYSSICSRTALISSVGKNEINQLRNLYKKQSAFDPTQSVLPHIPDQYELNIANSIVKVQRQKIVVLSLTSLVLLALLVVTLIFFYRKK